MRAGRSTQPIGRKGKAKHRGSVGGKLYLLLTHLGVVVAGDCAGANAPDTAFPPVIEAFEEEMIVLSDTGFHAKDGDPPNLKLCARGSCKTRMVVESVVAVDRRLSFQEGGASNVGRVPGALGPYAGRL